MSTNQKGLRSLVSCEDLAKTSSCAYYVFFFSLFCALAKTPLQSARDYLLSAGYFVFLFFLGGVLANGASALYNLVCEKLEAKIEAAKEEGDQ